MKRVQANPRTPRERIAADLLNGISSGSFRPGDHLPAIKTLAAQHGVSVSTVHRAFELLREWRVVAGSPGERPRVCEGENEVCPVGPCEPEAEPSSPSRRWMVTLRGPGEKRYPARVVVGDLAHLDIFRGHLLGIARIEELQTTDAGAGWIGRYELEVVPLDDAGTQPVLLRW